MNELLSRAKQGFSTLQINQKYIDSALAFLEDWLTKEEFTEYVPQIEHVIDSEYWDYLLDCFYQIIPFGTGGRRGEVGIGPNRINPWTIKSSAQGHSQYFLKKHPDEAKDRGVVLAYDVREFRGNKHLSEKIENPIKNMNSKDLARSSAEIYAANGIKVYLFEDVRTTPELSFAIRHLNAVGGSMFSASHNPPDHNGKKVFDQFGGQLIPPQDEELVVEVTENVSEVQQISFDEAKEKNLIQEIGNEVDTAYVQAAANTGFSSERDLKIVYTPLHGCGGSSVTKALETLGFEVYEDPKTSNPSGAFENVTFNIPNPEVIQSFDTTLKYAQEVNADIILSSDPDADRMGLMVKHQGKWEFVDGNEIAAILLNHVITHRKSSFQGDETVIKTMVTTDLMSTMCHKNNIRIVDDLLVGFKYVGAVMNDLQDAKMIDQFLFGGEESHGYIAGNYARDKDAVVAAVWLSELGASLKKDGKTLLDYRDMIYSDYGYYRNYLTEIRLLGAIGNEKIHQIQSTLRSNPPKHFGKYEVLRFEDCQNRKPIVSETDKLSKDVLVFHVKPVDGTQAMKVTIRPSGTEPKIKMYFEIGANPAQLEELPQTKEFTESLLRDFEKEFMTACYQIIGIDFPERGFLLFWQLPADDKMKYFEVEPQIEALKNEAVAAVRKEKLYEMLTFLGADPIEKVDAAFKKKNEVGILEYLSLRN